MSRSKGVLTLIAVLCLGAFAFGCGGDDGATRQELDQARAEGAKEAKQQAKEQAKLDALEAKVDQLQKRGTNQGSNTNQSGQTGGSGASLITGPVTHCTDGVLAGANTSCEFAMNVSGEYGSNPGSTSIKAFSPSTHEFYTLSCASLGGGTVCRGGNNASVFIP